MKLNKRKNGIYIIANPNMNNHFFYRTQISDKRNNKVSSKQFSLPQINFNRFIKIRVLKNCDDISGLSAMVGEIEDPSNEYINEQ